MKKLIFLIGILAYPAVFMGCATIYDGKTQTIRINTDPPEADVVVEEAWTKETVASDVSPMEVNLERKHSYHVKISKDGYLSTTVGIRRKANNAIIIDLLLLPLHPAGTGLGLVSAGIDHFTGAIWDLEPSDINVKLYPLKAEEQRNP